MSYLWTLDIPSEVLSSFPILISVTHAREPRSEPIVKPESDPLFGLSTLQELLVEDKFFSRKKT